MENLINSSGNKTQFLKMFEDIAEREDILFDESIKVILSCTYDNPELAANIKGSTKDQIRSKWLKKYIKGYQNRISLRSSNLPGTTPDLAVEFIIQGRLSHLSNVDLTKIRFAHRLAMSAENILGLLLEEYLAVNLKQFGWFCCWGDVVRAVDFCNRDGRLLQIKNRSNSENSSSSRVRANTEIKKWYRVNAQTGQYSWDDLNRMQNTEIFSEEHFIEFFQTNLRNNPSALAVEPNNPWGSQ
jgi:hypothetical protein